MPLMFMKLYTRRDIQDNPDWLFVFGDNFQRTGFAGQAKAARGETNAIGIPTKRFPSRAANAYLSDDDLREWKLQSHWAWDTLARRLRNGSTIVWPEDGIGTGLAQLPEFAPAIYAEIEARLAELKQIAAEQEKKEKAA